MKTERTETRSSWVSYSVHRLRTSRIAKHYGRLDPDRRSENMRRIRSKDTAPELQVRSLVHALGYRYRLHDKNLPGTPDLVFRSRGCVIFVHGCFWHLHANFTQARIPLARQEYWIPKLTGNVERDRAHTRKLRRLGWRVLKLWECELKSTEKLERKLTRFLDRPTSPLR